MLLINMKASTKKIALAAVMAALCVIILFLGSVISVLDLSSAALTSIVIVLCVIELDGLYPWLVWAVSSTLSLLLLPDKFGALVFLVFVGYYPMAKRFFERFSKLLQWILKVLFFNLALSLIIFFSKSVLGLQESPVEFSIIVYLICNLTFIIYDIALTRLITLYVIKLRSRFKIFRH